MRAYTRWLFGIAAAFNFAVAAGLAFLRPWLAPLLALEPVRGSNLVIAGAAAAMIAAFGYAYVRVAADPARFREYVPLAVAGKLAVVAASWWPFAAGAASWRVPSLSLADGLFALLFVDWMRRASPRSQVRGVANDARDDANGSRHDAG